MSEQRIERTHYFAGEALLTADFAVEQRYHMAMLRNHNRSLHTYGIARGLEVTHDGRVEVNQVEIAPGTAIDRLGREIVLVERVVLRIVDPTPGANYYLSITYDEAYADYTDESGVPGYKRVVQQPRIAYGLNLSDPGLNILLAVIGFSSQGAINDLTYKSGSFERRYVGAVLGTVAFVTEGSGVALDAQTDAVGRLSTTGMLDVGGQAETGGYASISANRETTSVAGEVRDYLLVDAPRTQFSGLATTRGNVGIGVDQPVANLQIDALSFKGPGTLASTGTLVQLSQAVQPFFQPGDTLVSDPSIALPAQTRTITAINPDHDQVTVDSAFNPALANAGYTYGRARLASFSTAADGCLFEVRADGSVGLGVQSAVQAGQASSGRSALVVSPDRKVGIALGETAPQAELDVNGALRASSATIAGKVVAGSFEGNGAKLVGLPILSFWTQESPGDPNSKLNYTPGNVGVRTTNSPASLGVGGGHSAIGRGLVTSGTPKVAGGVTTVPLTGYLTQFTKDVSTGDTITVGKIVQMPLLVGAIASDTRLSVDSQPPFVLYDWPYKIKPAHGPGKEGTGRLNSEGGQITGTGTHFLADLQPGDELLIDELVTEGVVPQAWFVDTVTSDTAMTVRQPVGDTSRFDASRSAYMVTQALLAQFQAQDTTLPPALQITTNRVDAANSDTAPNTVTINVALADLDPTYALQVDGNVNFTGGGGGGNVTVQTLIATRNIEIRGDASAPLLLRVGEAGGAAPLLGVTRDNVVLGQAAGDSKYLLDAKGDLHTSGNVVADQRVNADTLAGANLDVSGSRIASDGSVHVIGARSGPYTQADMTNGGTLFSRVAPTDGFVLATVGSVGDQFAYLGYLEGMSALGATATSYAYAAGACYPFSAGGDKKGGGTTFYPTMPGSFTLPVRAGETWTLTRTWLPSGTGFAAPSIEFYWVPLGTVSSQGGAAAEAMPRPAGDPAAAGGVGPMQAAMAALRARLQSGLAGPGSLETAQRTIDQRVDDLAQVFGDATHMSASPEDRATFVKDLQNIVCKAVPPGQVPDNAADPAHVQMLIDTFGRLTGHVFEPRDRGLLADGVNALVQINDNDQSRHDLNLIKTNVALFLDNVASAIGGDFGQADRRPLTRALVRLVGDGSQGGTGPAAGGAVLPAPGPLPPALPALPAAPASGGVPHPAADAFLQALEPLLGHALDDAEKGRLLALMEDIARRRPAADEAAGALIDGVESVAHVVLDPVHGAALADLVAKFLALP